MTYPNRETTLALLGDWKAHHDAVEKLMDGIKDCIGLDPDGPMFDTVWRLFDAYTASLAAQIGDFGGWLVWYQAENDTGKRGHEAGYDGKLSKIKSLVALYWLIEESRKREVRS